jgi:hypothetical protein
MIVKHSIWRVIAAVVLVLVLGFLCYGVIIFLHAKRVGLTEQSSPAEEPLAFLAHAKALGADATDAADCLQLATVGREVEKFRASAAAASDTKAMSALPAVAPGALQDLGKGEISARFPYLWPYVMAGSAIVIGNSLGNEPVVAFYNPYFDVALLTKWRPRDTGGTTTKPGFVMIQAIPMTGRAFLENRPSLATDQPVWSDANELFEVRIVNAAQGFVKTFEERYPPFDRSSVAFSAGAAAIGAAISVTENRVFDLLRWVIDAQNASAPVNYKSGIDQFREALAAPGPARLSVLLPADNPQGAPSFFQLPPGVRKGMKPYLVVGENVIFVDPIDLPTAFISVYFRPAAHGYVPGLAGFFNMEASYAAE